MSMHSFRVSFILLLITIIIIGCDTTFRQKLPDVDIVYQANDIDKPEIGFINADGTGNQALPISTFATDPVWSEDGKKIYFRMAKGDFGNIETRAGPISLWEEGKGVRSCDILDADPAYPVSETNDVIVHVLDAIQEINLITCKIEKTFVDDRQAGGGKSISSLSVSRGGQFILYSESGEPQSNSKLSLDYTMKIVDRTTGTVEDVGKGMNPSMSPDGRWIAYIWLDGIYLMKRDGTEKRNIIVYNAKENSGELDRFEKMPPKPRWSPDGKWLIYHKCLPNYPKPACDRLDDYSIFRYNLIDRSEEKVIDRGLNPYWR